MGQPIYRMAINRALQGSRALAPRDPREARLVQHVWFWAGAVGLLAAVPLHLASVDHAGLARRFGERWGGAVADALGEASGTMEMLFLLWLWLAPQPRSELPLASGSPSLVVAWLGVDLAGALVAAPLVAAGAYLGVAGVRAVGMRVADTHALPAELRTTGVYGLVRHPQYLGWALSHVGMSLLLGASYAMLFTPVLLAVIWTISRGEERDLSGRFGQAYEGYRARVPMLLPLPRRGRGGQR